MSEFAAFLGVSLVVIVTPGPDTALTIRNTLLGGRPAGFVTALGCVSGQACWTVAASAGVAALLVASEPAFLVLKFAGAAYLVFLGIQALRLALGPGEQDTTRNTEDGRALSARTAFRQGLVSDLGNPKVGAFFTSLLPQFAPSGGGAFWAMLGLGLVFGALTLAWLAAYVVALVRAGEVLRRPRVRRTIEGITGIALVALGLRLASEQRP
jgi:threonine/homoserine/homoserine lactone efflux protein